MGILQKVSSGHMKYILKGIQCRCFQVMSLLTGPGIGPPMYGRRGNRDGEKILCNSGGPSGIGKWPPIST